jgi:hypothetical protein
LSHSRLDDRSEWEEDRKKRLLMLKKKRAMKKRSRADWSEVSRMCMEHANALIIA